METKVYDLSIRCETTYKTAIEGSRKSKKLTIQQVKKGKRLVKLYSIMKLS